MLTKDLLILKDATIETGRIMANNLAGWTYLLPPEFQEYAYKCLSDFWTTYREQEKVSRYPAYAPSLVEVIEEKG